MGGRGEGQGEIIAYRAGQMHFIVPVWNGYDVAQGSNEWKLHKRTTLPKQELSRID